MKSFGKLKGEDTNLTAAAASWSEALKMVPYKIP